MTRKRRRLYFVLTSVSLLALGVGIILWQLSANIAFFCAPSDIHNNAQCAHAHYMRLGGLVAAGSVKHEADGSTLDFTVTDGKYSVPVTYSGIVPDLFREGQGVVVEGRLLADGNFKATTLLAKHDARYMPPEVVEALKKAGRWQEGENGKPIPPVAPAGAGATQ